MSETRIPEIPPPPPGLGNGPHANVLIARMREKADLSQEAQLPRGPERRTAVYRDLVATAERTQAPALAALAELKSDGLVTGYESMFLPNAISIVAAPGKAQAVTDALKGVADIASVTENKLWSIPTQPKGVAPAPAAVNGLEWGVQKIGAPAAWAKGYDGTGVTVGVIDTGLDVSHPAIKTHYRGTNADGSQTHDYNWYDPTSPGKTPYDDGQHGTHVGGSVAGGTPERGIGVAPGARLIAAKAILGNGYNTTDATLKALQFMLAPTDIHGRNPDPAKGVDIVNNSWGNANREDTTFVDTWEGLLAAGIIPVTSAGNDGPFGKVSPPGSYPNGISVAASTSGDGIASFSSRGPSPFDPKAVVPLIAAPGAGVTSAIPGGKYANFSGTSMAAPHVSGAVALMLQAKPNASYEEIVLALTSTATDIAGSGVDNAAGYGRINVDKAIEALLGASGSVVERAS